MTSMLNNLKSHTDNMLHHYLSHLEMLRMGTDKSHMYHHCYRLRRDKGKGNNFQLQYSKNIHSHKRSRNYFLNK